MKFAQYRSLPRLTLILLIVILIGSVAILSCVPPISRDALTHHLIVPKLYVQNGGIYEISSIVFSYYPMNLDLLYMIPLYFGNDIAPKYIHFIFALLTAGLIFCYLRKRLDTNWALGGAFFFLSLPIIVKLSITVYVDLGLVFFSTATIMSLFKWIERRFQVRLLILSAICCGLALGTKYNGLIVLFILTLFIPFIYISNSKKEIDAKDSANRATLIKIQCKALGFGTIFFIVALLVFSPWMIRNYVWKANPIYPLYDHVFNRQTPAPPNAKTGGQPLGPVADSQQISKAKSTRWGPFAIRKVIYDETWWEIALVPVRIFFQGRDDNPQYFDGRLNPFLFFLPFFAFVQLKNNPSALRTEKKILVFFAILFLLFVFSQTNMRIRWTAPIFPPLVILSILGLQQLNTKITHRWFAPTMAKRIGMSFAIFAAAAMIFLNASYIAKQFAYVKPFSYISGRVSRDNYIAKFRPEYKIFQYANQHLPENIKILGLFLGNRRYYSDRDLVFGVGLFENAVKETDSEDDFLDYLHEDGFTHLIIRYDLMNQWIGRQFNDGQKVMLKNFFENHTKNILSNDGYGLFELKKKDGAANRYPRSIPLCLLPQSFGIC